MPGYLPERDITGFGTNIDTYHCKGRVEGEEEGGGKKGSVRGERGREGGEREGGGREGGRGYHGIVHGSVGKCVHRAALHPEDGHYIPRTRLRRGG